MANTTWNPSDQSGVTLTNANLTATANTSAGAAVRTIDRQITGKFYWETTLVTGTVNPTGAGIASAAAMPLGNLGNGSLLSTPGFCIYYRNNSIYRNGLVQPQTPGTPANGSVICHAVDMVNRLYWTRLGAAGNWNGSAANNPATGVGGIDISMFGGGAIPIYPVVAMGATNDAWTANFGDIAFTGVVPSGFTSGFTAGASIPTTALATQTAVLAFGSAPSVAQLTQAAILEFATPNPDAQLTQLAAEQWYVGVPDVQLTNIFLEQWAQVNAINTQAVLTQILLEEWTSVALAGGAVTGNGPMISVIM